MEREQSEGLQGVENARQLPPSVVAAAHELKSPLVLIRQLALGLEDSGDRESLTQITLTAERALRLTSDITKQARLEDSFFSSEACQAYVVCHEVLGEIAPLFAAHGRAIRIKRSRRSSPLIVTNRDLLRRILLAFADNALHYAGQSSDVELRVSTVGSTTVRFSVRDFGPSVPARLWERLQNDLGVRPQAISARPLSSGLGLIIAKQFADHIQATIGVIRHKNGATFYVDVPASSQLSLL